MERISGRKNVRICNEKAQDGWHSFFSVTHCSWRECASCFNLRARLSQSMQPVVGFLRITLRGYLHSGVCVGGVW